MKPIKRVTRPTVSVLEVLIDAYKKEDLSGADITKKTGLGTGSIYPLLKRLEDLGWLVSRWEDIDPSIEGRPKRRLYELSATARPVASQLVDEYRRPKRGWRGAMPV